MPLLRGKKERNIQIEVYLLYSQLKGIKEGWYDRGNILFVVILVIVFTSISDYRQSLQFQNLNNEKRNIQLEVIRGGRRIHVSIFDLVVGDVVPLKIGDQVPADGILISGHSLVIDESNMTGESKIIHKDQKAPFLMSGWKVTDGYGYMLPPVSSIKSPKGVVSSPRVLVSPYIGFEASVIGVESSVTGVEASVTGVEASLTGVDALTSGVDPSSKGDIYEASSLETGCKYDKLFMKTKCYINEFL
ncbi:hypothetical protein H6P81_003287 [Aristolochia fimbriata]|uniref:P-type ATPase A domain-containing protein n=1 Tax=Aristolochia fimbriata TaxID=158543 RepID=A0AAV7FDV0_ARIFI|nr:hypothetical protein H6P81_003287 [Aristolochia fimbriata]